MRAGSLPGLLVQPVDVLGDQRVEPPAALEVDQRAVPGVGLGRPHRRGQPVLPRPRPQLGVATRRPASVAIFSASGFLVQTPCGPPEVGDARVGRDAGAGQHDDPSRLFQQRTGPCRRRRRRHAVAVARHRVHRGHGGTAAGVPCPGARGARSPHRRAAARGRRRGPPAPGRRRAPGPGLHAGATGSPSPSARRPTSSVPSSARPASALIPVLLNATLTAGRARRPGRRRPPRPSRVFDRARAAPTSSATDAPTELAPVPADPAHALHVGHDGHGPRA